TSTTSSPSERATRSAASRMRSSSMYASGAADGLSLQPAIQLAPNKKVGSRPLKISSDSNPASIVTGGPTRKPDAQKPGKTRLTGVGTPQINVELVRRVIDVENPTPGTKDLDASWLPAFQIGAKVVALRGRLLCRSRSRRLRSRSRRCRASRGSTLYRIRR